MGTSPIRVQTHLPTAASNGGEAAGVGGKRPGGNWFPARKRRYQTSGESIKEYRYPLSPCVAIPLARKSTSRLRWLDAGHPPHQTCLKFEFLSALLSPISPHDRRGSTSFLTSDWVHHCFWGSRRSSPPKYAFADPRADDTRLTSPGCAALEGRAVAPSLRLGMACNNESGNCSHLRCRISFGGSSKLLRDTPPGNLPHLREFTTGGNSPRKYSHRTPEARKLIGGAVAGLRQGKLSIDETHIRAVLSLTG